MTTVSEEASKIMANPIAEDLKNKGISRVMIVDDTFDNPARSDFENNELSDFWAALPTDVSTHNEIVKNIFGVLPTSEDEITDAHVYQLYTKRDELGPFQEAFDAHLRPTLENKHSTLNTFISYLENDLQLEVIKHGTSFEGHQPVDIVFLDYYLGFPNDEGSVGNSRDTIRRMLRAYPDTDNKPLVVLMSSHNDVKGSSEDFRAQTGLVGGMFYFVPKSDLSDLVKLVLNLDMLVAAIPIGHRIQKFLENVESHADTIKSEFLAGIKRLNLDDYMYIQRLSLGAEGHPLGDYLLWLYSAYFGHLMFEKALSNERRDLDTLTFDNWIPSHVTPSEQLSNMYYSALFDTNVGPLSEHPRLKNPSGPEVITNVADTISIKEESNNLEASHSYEKILENEITNVTSMDQSVVAGEIVLLSPDEPGTANSEKEIQSPEDPNELARHLPYFSLGDIFLRESGKDILMVSNPACDLAFAPDHKRLLDPMDSLILIPGSLERMNGNASDRDMRTEIFRVNNESFRVYWHTKRLITIPYMKAAGWLKAEGFSRVARLRMPFCLEIQHHFASNLTRVGVPVPPPFYSPLYVSVYERGRDGKRGKRLDITDSDAEAFVIGMKRNKDTKCAFTAGLVRTLQSHLQNLLHQLESSISPETEVPQRTAERIQNASAALSNLEGWRELSAPFALPETGKIKDGFRKVQIVVGNNIPVEQVWTGNSLLLVHLSESLETENAIPSSETSNSMKSVFDQKFALAEDVPKVPRVPRFSEES
jgi:hypothetical protein